MAAAGFGTFINLYPTQAILPTLAQEFGASLPHTGLTLTAPLLAVALVAPFVGGISDALGRRRLIVGAAFALVVPTLLGASAPDLDALVLCRFLQGLLLPFIFAVTVAYIAEECPGAEAVRVTGTYALGTIVGGFGGRFVAGWATQYLGWHSAFLALAVLTAACALVIWACLPPERLFRPVRGWRGSLGGFARPVPQPAGDGDLRRRVLRAVLDGGDLHLRQLPAGRAALRHGSGAAGVGVRRSTCWAWWRRRWRRGWPCGSGGGGRCCGRAGRRVRAAADAAASLSAILLGLSLAAAGIFTEQVLSLGYVASAARGARSTAVGAVRHLLLRRWQPGWHPACWHLGSPGLARLRPAGAVVQAVALAVTQTVWPRHPPAPATPPT